MESSQCQLSTGLANRLRGDNAHRLSFFYQTACCQIASITLGTNTVLAFAGEHRTYLNTFNRGLINFSSNLLGYLFTGSNQNLTGRRMYDIMNRYTTQYALVKRSDNLLVLLQGCTNKTAQCTAVLLGNNNIM
ncbi:MAG: hypothetical protein BWY95_01840 [Bacteroidetes bacterium ADurb.BinA104]|nr:MAG: hypothetical protein BWY95_01840 [Bacteroidetes bacterium ADurb.BinA104]